MATVDLPPASIFADPEFSMFAESVGRFLDDHAGPDAMKRWRQEGIVPRDMWTRAAAQGLLGLSMPTEYGGAGGDFRHEAVLVHQLGLRGVEGWAMPLHNAIVAPYILHYGTEAQKLRWLPKLCSGESVGAIAMTEPGTGSDLQGVRTTARRSGNGYVVKGSKTFITNGQTADLIIVVAKTDPAAGAKGTSLIMVEAGEADGFQRGRNLEKLGMEAADTSELFFDDVFVPADNMIGLDEGRGFIQLMEQLPQERLMIAWEAYGMMERALMLTVAYVKERRAFGKAIMDFQNTQFKLAEVKTKITVARAFLDRCVELHLHKALDAPTASMAKLWLTETNGEIVDTCLQLFGGYGYMAEYPIAEMYKDERVKRIYGGTSEIMKLLIARTL